jgi:hypothetical protein
LSDTPAEWFNTPEPDQPQPLTIGVDGRVTGHLALWNQCHTGFSECVQAPRGDSFDNFHVGAVETDSGTVAVGKIVYSTKHADLGMVAATASRHYDDNGHVGAYVRAVNGRHGIWLSGVTRPGLDQEGLVTMRANPPSGDWRSIGNKLSLIAALAVPIPGFPVARAMAASGALILEGYDGQEDQVEAEPRSKGFLRQRAMIAAALTTKARNSLSRSAFAIPETRSYPIQDESHARNALARSSGKPEAARVRRAVCRRYPDLPSCKSK